jgi:transcriptional regulator with XRE-family HTH domain
VVDAESTTNFVPLAYNLSDRLLPVFDTERFRQRLRDTGISQAELARRIGISQQAIGKLATGGAYGSKHLHRIARELGTTPAYLAGETDDPNADAADERLSSEEQRLLEIYRELPKKDRAALKVLIAMSSRKLIALRFHQILLRSHAGAIRRRWASSPPTSMSAASAPTTWCTSSPKRR